MEYHRLSCSLTLPPVGCIVSADMKTAEISNTISTLDVDSDV